MNNTESDVKGDISAFYFAEALQSQHLCVVQKRIGSYEACQYSVVMDPRQFFDLPLASTAHFIFKGKKNILHSFLPHTSGQGAGSLDVSSYQS